MDLATKFKREEISSTVRFVHFLRVPSSLRHSGTMCKVTSTGVLVNNEMTLCDMKISSFSTVMLLSSCVSSFKFLQWCFVVPRRGLSIYTKALERL